MTLLLLVALPLFAQQTALLLPFDNVSGADGAPEVVTALLAKTIEADGWKVVQAPESLLEEKRIRYLDSLDDATRQELLAGAKANAIVTGTIYSFNNNVVALSARLVAADGTLLRAGIAGVSSDDTEGAFGLGRKTTANDIAAVAVDRVMRPASRSLRPFLARPITFRSWRLDPKVPHAICVLPFDSNAAVPEATRIVADVLAVRLAEANGFDVVEPAVMRKAALDAGIGTFRSIGTPELKKIAKATGTSLFLRGTIFAFSDAKRSVPMVDLELMLVDVDSGKVLWNANHTRKGSDYTGFLMLGAVSNAVTLTDRVVAEMIQSEQQAKPRRTNEDSGIRLSRNHR